jgi:hypothetical protein
MSEDELADHAVGSPTRLALNVLAHKWTLLIALALKGAPLRFTRLRSMVPGVTSQVLTASPRGRRPRAHPAAETAPRQEPTSVPGRSVKRPGDSCSPAP